MWRFGLFIAPLLFIATATAAKCDFQYDPATTSVFYRASGWTLPGVSDFNTAAKPQVYGSPRVMGNIPGAKAQLLPHDEYPYVVEFPSQEFVIGSDKEKTRPMQAKAVIARYIIAGKIVAYSYGLIPVRARRKNGKWEIESEVACVFTATFIDDKGDGIFRVLARGPFTPDLVPHWAKLLGG